MNIRYAKPIDKEQVVSVWNYCFEDGEDFVKYYFENVYDENNTIIIEENDEVLSALQLNKYTIDLRDNKYDVSYVVGVSSKPEVRGLGYMKHLMTYTLEELYKSGEIVSLLMAIDYRLYKRYGFDHCYDQIQYNIKTDELSGFRVTSKLRKADFEGFLLHGVFPVCGSDRLYCTYVKGKWHLPLLHHRRRSLQRSCS